MRKGIHSTDTGVVVPGAFKLDHLQPVKQILFPKFSKCFTLILGGEPTLKFHRERKAQNEKDELSQSAIKFDTTRGGVTQPKRMNSHVFSLLCIFYCTRVHDTHTFTNTTHVDEYLAVPSDKSNGDRVRETRSSE